MNIFSKFKKTPQDKVYASFEKTVNSMLNETVRDRPSGDLVDLGKGPKLVHKLRNYSIDMSFSSDYIHNLTHDRWGAYKTDANTSANRVSSAASDSISVVERSSKQWEWEAKDSIRRFNA